MRWWLLPLIIFILNLKDAYPQMVVTQGSAMGMTPLQLVQSKLVGQGITVLNAKFNGSSSMITSNQAGIFTTSNDAYTQLGLAGGIILSCGTAVRAVGPNNTAGATGTIPAGPGDPDLTLISNSVTNDAAVLEFDFKPVSDTLKFRYVMGSEEFFEFCNQYNDAFGFFLSGPGIAGIFSMEAENIALMPESIAYVTINNICADNTSRWDNSGGLYYQYDALTHVFTAWHIVQPCQVYHIKLAIADAVDHVLDSGVFLEQNSFSSSGVQLSTEYSVTAISRAVEACSDAVVTFSLPWVSTLNQVINYTITGTATNGVDFPAIPLTVTIPAGQLTTTLTISPIDDGIPEGVESVIISLINACQGLSGASDTLYIGDNTPLVPYFTPDTIGCLGSSITLHSLGMGGQMPYTYKWTTGAVTPNVLVPVLSGTTSYGIKIKDACSDSIVHTINVTSHGPAITNSQTVFSQCSSISTNITLQASVGGATFAWTAANPGGMISGYSAGSGSLIFQILNNTGSITDTVYYHVIASEGTCPGNETIFKVAVHPFASVTATPQNQSICSGNTVTINLTPAPANSNLTWTASCINPGITGFSSGSGPVISQIINATPAASGDVNYIITPSFSNCPGTQASAIVFVFPGPETAFPGCFDEITTINAAPIVLKGGIPPGGTYSGPGVSSGIFTPSAAGTGLKNISYSYTNISGCSSSASVSIQVRNEPAFTCGNLLTDVRDNKNYPTVLINGKCWMATNLEYGNYISSAGTQRDNCIPEKFCYENNSVNCLNNGGLYQWDELMQYTENEGAKGLCPPAWHLPSEAEWNSLFAFFGNNAFAGSALKISGFSGFEASLQGGNFDNVSYHLNGFAAFFWSSTRRSAYKAWAHALNTPNPSVSFYPANRSDAFSVRCIRD